MPVTGKRTQDTRRKVLHGRRGYDLPRVPSPPVGRKSELRLAQDSLRDPDIRLLTITGPPGVGKTRFALHVVSKIAGLFDHGVAFVDLTPIRDPALATHAIVRSLRLPERDDHPLQQLHQYLLDRHLLLLLDNFEQVVTAAPQIAALLAACPDVKAVVTSREPLHISWEHEFPLRSLEAPDPAWLARPEAALRYPAVELFVQRAREVQPDFSLESENGKAVAAICRRLDGLPLAIELAAARIRHFSPQTILSRLEHSLEVLTVGPRDAAARHRTLRDAIAWSYDLLSESEQAAFGRLGVFAGGCTLEAVRAVCVDLRANPLEVVTSLVDKNLLARDAQDEDEARFRMLETVREFALERLTSRGELEAAQRLHASFFLTVLEAARGGLALADQSSVARIGRDAENSRVALEWCWRHDARMALVMAGLLGRFWYLRAQFSYGRQWLKVVIAVADHEYSRERAAALGAAGVLAQAQGDYGEAVACLEESLAIRRAQGDLTGVARTLGSLSAVAYQRGDLRQARALAEESLALAREGGEREALAGALVHVGNVVQREGDLDRADACFKEAFEMWQALGNRASAADALTNLGNVANDRGDNVTACRYHEESVAIRREIDDRLTLGLALNNYGNALSALGRAAEAQTAYEEALVLAREVGDRRRMGFALNGLGSLARGRGDFATAHQLYGEALRIRHDLGEKLEVFKTLENIAKLALVQRDYARAVTLGGASTAMRESIGAALRPVDRPLFDRDLAEARRKVGGRAYDAHWGRGREMVFDQAVEFALSPGRVARRAKTELSQRESQVARMIARGLTNRQIASELFISERTVDTYVENVLNKLGFDKRAQIAAWAAKQGLDAEV